MKCKLFLLAACFSPVLAPVTATKAMAQKQIGDFIESKSNNEAKRGAARTLPYRPEGDAFVCVNGKNRYTRALYGGYTDYRLETSDRPIFAVFKKGYHRNIRFLINGVPAETTDYCKAWYATAQLSSARPSLEELCRDADGGFASGRGRVVPFFRSICRDATRGDHTHLGDCQ